MRNSDNHAPTFMKPAIRSLLARVGVLNVGVVVVLDGTIQPSEIWSVGAPHERS